MVLFLCSCGLFESTDVRVDFNLISDFFAHHKTPFSEFLCSLNAFIEKHIFSGISDNFRLFLTDALTTVSQILSK